MAVDGSSCEDYAEVGGEILVIDDANILEASSMSPPLLFLWELREDVVLV